MGAAAIALIFLAFFVGGIIAWLYATREGARAKEAADLLRLQRDELVLERDSLRQQRDDAERQRAALEADARNFDTRLSDLQKSRETLVNQFREIGDQLLGEARQKFLDQAGEKLTEVEKNSSTRLELLLQPFNETLKRYETDLRKIENDRVGSYDALKLAINELAQGNDQVRREAQRLANVMVSSPKARGRWGEEQLKTILESAGLGENIDFAMQTAVSDGERRLQPDCVINLPGERCIVVDVKCPLVAFEQAFDEEDEERRQALLLQHAAALKSYANDLGKKSYWRQFERSPDFVIMFVPGEHHLAAAAERAPDLIEGAFKNGVIVTSTINMLALAKIMAGMWRQQVLATQAKEIAEVGKELYRRLLAMGGHVSNLGRRLGQAADSYNDFIGSLERNVLTQAQRFESLGIETGGRAIEQMPVIHATPKPLMKLSDSASTEEPPQIAAE